MLEINPLQIITKKLDLKYQINSLFKTSNHQEFALLTETGLHFANYDISPKPNFYDPHESYFLTQSINLIEEVNKSYYVVSFAKLNYLSVIRRSIKNEIRKI